MTNTEKTFADRLGRGRLMLAAVELFVPPFAPTDEDISAAEFAIYLDSLESANLAAGEAVDEFRVKAGERVDFVKDLKKTTTRALNYVKSNKAWDKHLPSLKSVADKLRGHKVSRPKMPGANGETPDDAKRRQTGEQSYADIAGQFSRFVNALQKIAGYAPPAAEITIAALQAKVTQMNTLNLEAPNAEQEAKLRQKERLDLYNDKKEGLNAKMKAIKAAVIAQYGGGSEQARAVKAIRV